MHWLLFHLFFVISLTVYSYKPSNRHFQTIQHSKHFKKNRFIDRIQLQLSPLNTETIITNPLQSSFEVESTFSQTSTFLTAVTADFAAQIEEAVGPEVYGPIFLYGIFLGFSGVLVCAIAVFIITKFNLEGELNRQFDEGKKAQLIPIKESSTINNQNPFEGQSKAKGSESTEGNKTRGRGGGDDVVENIDI